MALVKYLKSIIYRSISEKKVDIENIEDFIDILMNKLDIHSNIKYKCTYINDSITHSKKQYNTKLYNLAYDIRQNIKLSYIDKFDYKIKKNKITLIMYDNTPYVKLFIKYNVIL
jgi:hypothetical protein